MPHIIIAGAIAAVGSIAASSIASSAAKKAAKTQTQAANQAAVNERATAQQALGLQEQQWEAGQKALSPYTSWSPSVASKLGQVAGINPMGSGQPPQGPGGPTLGGAMGQQGPTRGVMLKAPDGSTQMVDPKYVDHFVQRGATVIGGGGGGQGAQFNGPRSV